MPSCVVCYPVKDKRTINPETALLYMTKNLSKNAKRVVDCVGMAGAAQVDNGVYLWTWSVVTNLRKGYRDLCKRMRCTVYWNADAFIGTHHRYVQVINRLGKATILTVSPLSPSGTGRLQTELLTAIVNGSMREGKLPTLYETAHAFPCSNVAKYLFG